VRNESKEFKEGYLAALKDVFDCLTKKHHDPREFDRRLIDDVWDDVKKLEEKARNNQ